MDEEVLIREVKTMVAANDRRAWRRGLRLALRVAWTRLTLAWSSVALAGTVLWLLPVNVRAG